VEERAGSRGVQDRKRLAIVWHRKGLARGEDGMARCTGEGPQEVRRVGDRKKHRVLVIPPATMMMKEARSIPMPHGGDLALVRSSEEKSFWMKTANLWEKRVNWMRGLEGGTMAPGQTGQLHPGRRGATEKRARLELRGVIVNLNRAVIIEAPRTITRCTRPVEVKSRELGPSAVGVLAAAPPVPTRELGKLPDRARASSASVPRVSHRPMPKLVKLPDRARASSAPVPTVSHPPIPNLGKLLRGTQRRRHELVQTLSGLPR
jgi:hypothetical protein